jgi:hypothetical protein
MRVQERGSMRLARLAFVVFAIVIISNGVLLAQTAPNLENGWKPFGSYDGTHLDTVNLLNGNLMLHAPIVGQRQHARRFRPYQ